MDVSMLSNGALRTICQGGKVEKFLVQVLSHKLIANSKTDRYRLFLSDGQYSNSFSMLSTDLNEKVINGELDQLAIIRVTNYVCNKVHERKVIIVLGLEVVHKGEVVGKKLGSPLQMNGDGSVSGNPPPIAAPAKRKAEEPIAGQEAKRSPLTTRDNRPRSSILEGRPSMGAGPGTPLDPDKAVITPITALTPYQNKFVIKVRVTNKSDIRRWSNSRGEGYLFDMNLVDSSGEIKAVAFKEQCDKFYNMIEVGKLYLITSCGLKQANKQFNALNHDYELSFRESTQVMAVSEEDGGSKIPTISFNFVKIGDLSSVDKDSIVDVIGVCKSAGDAVTITSQRTQKELVKRDLVLVDQSLTEVNMTLWGTKAETFNVSDSPVVAVKSAKVSDYNGVSLSALHSSVIQVNPDLPQAHMLKGWYDQEGNSAETSSLTQAGGNRADAAGSNVKTLGEAKLENQHLTEDSKPTFFSTSGYIVMFKKDQALYKGCIRTSADGKQCNKKVLDQGNGAYRCEKCNTENDRFNWRIIVSLSLADMTGNQWVTCFQEQAEMLLKIDAATLGEYFENDQDRYHKVFQDALFKRYNFRLSARADHYNEASRIKATLRSVSEISWVDQMKRMAKELKEAGMDLPEKMNHL